MCISYCVFLSVNHGSDLYIFFSHPPLFCIVVKAMTLLCKRFWSRTAENVYVSDASLLNRVDMHSGLLSPLYLSMWWVGGWFGLPSGSYSQTPIFCSWLHELTECLSTCNQPLPDVKSSVDGDPIYKKYALEFCTYTESFGDFMLWGYCKWWLN